MSDIQKGLELMRKPFPAHLVSKLPKPTKQQNDIVKNNYKEGIRCEICGGWHHPAVVHLDYVGHAALTDRLLECDQNWNWEPMAVDENGLPFVDRDGGMWIKLTVCGVTRLGYGDAENKVGPTATKERIGDALRNAAMRFGAALDLWSKEDLHQEEPADQGKTTVGDADKSPVQENKKAGRGNGKQKDAEPETKKEPAVPEYYPADKFAANSVKWKGLVKSGRKTPETLITFLASSGAVFSGEQLKEINSWSI